MAVFAVRTAKGPNWVTTSGIREQPEWDEHAEFADGLVDAGVIILGGPIDSDDGDVALMAVESIDEEHVRSIFAEDPWAASGVLRIKEVRPWTLWLDGRQRRRQGSSVG